LTERKQSALTCGEQQH